MSTLHDELTALVHKWRSVGANFVRSQDCACTCADELEAILSVEVAEAQTVAEWLKPLFEVYHTAWHFLDDSGQGDYPCSLDIMPERRDTLEAALAAFEVALPPTQDAEHVLWKQLAPQQRAGSEEGETT